MKSMGWTSIVITLVASTITHNKLSFPDREKGGKKVIINKNNNDNKNMVFFRGRKD